MPSESKEAWQSRYPHYTIELEPWRFPNEALFQACVHDIMAVVEFYSVNPVA